VYDWIFTILKFKRKLGLYYIKQGSQASNEATKTTTCQIGSLIKI